MLCWTIYKREGNESHYLHDVIYIYIFYKNAIAFVVELQVDPCQFIALCTLVYDLGGLDNLGCRISSFG